MSPTMTTKDRLEALEGRIADLEEVIQTLHLDMAAAEVKKTKSRRKKRPMSEAQKLAFRARMLEGRATAAKDAEKAKALTEMAASARREAEAAKKAEQEVKAEESAEPAPKAS